ncbi:flagellar M-ring protein FliF [Frischella perrara]|uniref:Flagellar M-ring protein n=1 Tax=Frischella perrara TaxID=1267021 RepID=A0A0A7S9C7_FRIPE|nr:flagellar basal-body MS-ring/collar protein FliF [Frischella perrara]AJA45891.1 flagellar basal-body M-ring protein/flagellar hook-basal body protein (fliF) [Frischella perrara]PWV62573.1 flagellar M-ring protein FliF [Frischella perrara]
MNTQTVGNKGSAASNALSFINRLKQNPKMLLLIGGVIVTAIIMMALLWLKEDKYGVLFSNVSNQDGGEIVSQLEKMNIAYQFSAGGSAILIPENKVYDTRLRLAQQGLPKGGAVGFELLDKERFGMSQFTEQVNYQRALEGELSRTISTINSIESARVHLAMPKPSLFVRERKQPTASVTLSLYAGRSLSQGQIDAIIHLIASSVPEMVEDKVTIIDQHGHLLTNEQNRNILLNATQIDFAERIEKRIRDRIVKLVGAVVGNNNVNVQVTADIDFSRQESTMERFDPNSDIANQTIRSKHQTENLQSGNVNGVGGVPGALSNQPVPIASAPIDEAQNENKTTEQTDNQKYSQQRDDTLNFEVNRHIVHSQIPEGRIKRLSVAVLVNYQAIEKAVQSPEDSDDVEEFDESDNPTSTTDYQRLDEEVLNNIEALARQAMGYSSERGDTLTVANLKFTQQPTVDDDGIAFWKTSEFYDAMKTYVQYIVWALIIWVLWRKFIKPIWLKWQNQIFANKNNDDESQNNNEENNRYKAYSRQQQKNFEDSLQQQQYIREMVTKDPRVLALIIRGWMNDKDGQ